MKITIEDHEVATELCNALVVKFGGEWECLSESYRLHDLQFQQITPETIKAKAEKEARMEEWRKKCEAEDTAARVASGAVAVDTPL